MNFLNKLFNKPLIDCPRCLGKGNVDLDDIKRLKQELKWLPGPCAYCNGKGKVPSDFPNKISADNVYLTSDLTLEERKKVVSRDAEIIKILQVRNNQADDFIRQVLYLYFIGNLEIDKIIEFYSIPRYDEEMNLEQKKELAEYIGKIIEFEKGK